MSHVTVEYLEEKIASEFAGEKYETGRTLEDFYVIEEGNPRIARIDISDGLNMEGSEAVIAFLKALLEA